MSAWLRRNTVPILVVLAASAAVIAAFELLDSRGTSEPLVIEGVGEPLHIGGLIKVTLFLAIPGAITLLVRRTRSAG